MSSEENVHVRSTMLKSTTSEMQREIKWIGALTVDTSWDIVRIGYAVVTLDNDS